MNTKPYLLGCYFILVTFLWPIHIGAQHAAQRLDSLRNEYPKKTGRKKAKFAYGLAYFFQDYFHQPDSQMAYIERGLQAAQRLDAQDLVAEGWRMKAYFFQNNPPLDSSQYYLDQSLELYQTLGDTSGMASVYAAMARLCSKRGDNDGSTKNTLKAAELFEAIGEKKGMAVSYLNLGVPFSRTKQYDYAILYFEKAYELKDHLHSAQLALVLYSLAQEYAKQAIEKEDSTLKQKSFAYAREGKQLASQKELIYYQAQFLVLSVGWNVELEEYKLAIRQSDSLLVLARKLNNPKLRCEAFLGKSNGLLGLKQFNAAQLPTDSAVYWAERLNLDNYLAYVLENKYEMAKGLGNYGKALGFLEQFKYINDTLRAVERSKAMKELEVKYQTAKREKEIIQLSKEANLLLLDKQQLRTHNYLLISILTLILSIVVFSVLWYKRKELIVRSQRAELEQKLLRAQMNPHFLFNSLNSIQRFYIEGRIDEANKYLADFAALLREILNRSSKTTVSLEEEIEFLERYLALEKRRLHNQLDYDIRLSAEVKASDYQVPSFILQPIVENAIWHGIVPARHKGQINIDLSQDGGFLKCTIEDNGIGYHASQQDYKPDHESKGLSLLGERLGTKGRYHVEEKRSESGAIMGTLFTLQLAGL